MNIIWSVHTGIVGMVGIGRIYFRKMFSTILSNAETAEKRLADIKNKVEEIKKIKIEKKIQDLIKENSILAKRVEEAKSELISLEIAHGKKQYSVPGKQTNESTSDLNTLKNKNEETKTDNSVNNVQPPIKEKKEKNLVKKSKEKVPTAPTSENIIDIRKLDLRIGKIIEVNKHPDADSLYVEKIDCGEQTPRTVVSGLVNHIPIDDMQDKFVMVLCNLKPVKMRGITSEAMVMCASSPEKVEVLIPPPAVLPGDLVHCEGYPREPEVQLNPKKKIFETCAPDLKTNDDKIACYKDSPLVVPGKGVITAPSLKGVNVK